MDETGNICTLSKIYKERSLINGICEGSFKYSQATLGASRAEEGNEEAAKNEEGKAISKEKA